MRVMFAPLAMLMVAGIACARARQDGPPHLARAAKADPRLRAVAASGTNAVVGVFISTTRPGLSRARYLELFRPARPQGRSQARAPLTRAPDGVA